MEFYRCPVCGYIEEGPLPDGYKCPRCKQPGENFVKVSMEEMSSNPYEGTKTCARHLPARVRQETNTPILLTLPPARALNSLRRSSLKPHATSRSTPAFGARSWDLSVPQPRTSSTLPRARILSGRICTTASPRKQRRRALQSLLPSSVWLALLRRRMRSVTAPCLKTWR